MGKMGYWYGLATAVQTLTAGLRLTFGHIWKSRRTIRQHDVTKPGYFQGQSGIATIQFPHETIPVPDNGRYQLHNEIDDCIVCDKCAKVCPVDCITIEPIKSTTEIGKTSDGTSKRIYAAKFDIDMAKCCFCGLCTTVCPTECLTMTKTYDYSAWEVKEHNFVFAEMTPQEIELRKNEWEESQKAKQLETTPINQPVVSNPPAGAKPVFKPRIKPPGPGTQSGQ
jgi:NADH-quinone oxidoreductase subunit I